MYERMLTAYYDEIFRYCYHYVGSCFDMTQGNKYDILNKMYGKQKGGSNMYQADDKRYEKMKYNRCGNSGLMLPAVSLGFWHNFGS